MSKRHEDVDEVDQIILQTRASVISKINSSTDFDAVLADIYAKAAKEGTPEAASAPPEQSCGESRTALDDVCAHIDMLITLLKNVSGPNAKDSPIIGGLYLSSAWRSLQRLRNGLSAHRIGEGEALRFIRNSQHNLREADTALRSEQGLSLDDALRDRIGDLMEIGSDITSEIQVLHAKVARLFDSATEAATVAPVPSA